MLQTQTVWVNHLTKAACKTVLKDCVCFTQCFFITWIHDIKSVFGSASTFLGSRFQFFFSMRFLLFETIIIVHALWQHCSWDPQPLYLEKNIKNGSHGIIYIFKNYFAKIFSVSAKISCIQTDLKWHL